ncbi:hypothetical protein PQX77_018091 [Marasmius sp. AFHP31]|nr:hypothetical protein PQX77_018091 [Marasmius sp. AFHP31]
MQWSSSVAPATKLEEQVAVIKRWLNQAIPMPDSTSCSPTTTGLQSQNAITPPPAPRNALQPAATPTTSTPIVHTSPSPKSGQLYTATNTTYSKPPFSKSNLEIGNLQAPEALTLVDDIGKSDNNSDDEDEDEHAKADWIAPMSDLP